MNQQAYASYASLWTASPSEVIREHLKYCSVLECNQAAVDELEHRDILSMTNDEIITGLQEIDEDLS